MDEQKVADLFEVKKWHFAKTMPTIPHFYVRRKEWGDDKEFNEVVLFLRQNSVAEKWYRRTFHYYYHGGWKYWTMGEPVNETQVINRARP